MEMMEKSINLRGLKCPLPALKTRKVLSGLAAGEQPVSFTSSYVSASYHPAGGFNVDAGFDNRRSVRLYRDATDPLTAFDDGYRQGAWGAVGFAGRHARVRAEGRTNGGVGSGRVLGVEELEIVGRERPVRSGEACRGTCTEQAVTEVKAETGLDDRTGLVAEVEPRAVPRPRRRRDEGDPCILDLGDQARRTERIRQGRSRRYEQAKEAHAVRAEHEDASVG